MAKYVIDGETLSKIAGAIRTVKGTDDKYTPEQMIEQAETILDDLVYILVDQTGREIPATLVEERVEITATPNDIRAGTVAVTGDGVVTGEKDIPAYYVTEGYRLISKGSAFTSHAFDDYDFTKFQAILCPWSGELSSSTAADKVVIEEQVYSVNSNIPIATISRDVTNRKIDLGITNTSNGLYVMRYFTYKEEY